MTVAQSPEPAVGSGLGSLLRDGRARLYFAGLGLSLFGDTMLVLVAGVWVKSLTGSDGAAALVMFFVSVPALLTPLFGLLADRVRRRPLIMATNLTMAVVTLALLLVGDAGEVWLIYAVMGAYGCAIALIGTAESGLFVSMLPSRLLGAANSLGSSLQESTKVIAPVVGAALFAWLGGRSVVAFDAVTFLAAATALFLLRVREPAPQPGEPDLRGELLAGFRHIRGGGGKDLRQVVFCCGAVLLVVGFTQTALYGVVEAGLHRPPAFLGLLVSLQGVGSVLGGLIAAGLIARMGEVRFVTAGIALSAVGTALLTIPSLGPVLLGMAVRGVGLPWLVIGAYTLMQRRTPVGLQGRAAGAVSLIIFTPQAVSVLVGAGLGAFVGHRVLLAVTTVSIVAVFGYLLSRSNRNEPSPGTAGTPGTEGATDGRQ